MHRFTQPRFHSQVGIAIGPILFVVAILAILATAIAAGSSTFATNAAQEGARTNAGAMLQIGETLKLGTDRVIGLGTAPASVTYTGAATTADIFSTTGGGLVPPSTALAAVPNSADADDNWIYTTTEASSSADGLGTTEVDRVAVIRISSTMCDQVNLLASGLATPAGADYGAIAAAVTFDGWPASLSGKLSGCIHNTNATSTGYYFYQILYVQ